MNVRLRRRTAFPRRRTAGRGVVLAGVAALSACHSAPMPSVATPPVAAAVSVVPPQAPRTTGIETKAAADRDKLVEQFGGAYDAPKAERYINQILARLAAASDKRSQTYRVTVLDTPMVNAFAMPSGDLYVTRGLLALANDASELAAVMAHEIGHVLAHHAAKREEFQKNGDLFRRVASRFEGPEKAAEVQAHSRLSLAGFSREQEFEADQIGVRTIGRAGYDPYGAARFLASLERSAALRASLFAQKSGDEKPDLMSTHPTTPERIARATQVAREIGAPGIGERARDDYLASIDGMAFGDDPAGGIAIGAKFVHPRLDFAFTAPDGFVLDNSAQAVLGLADGGNQALRLDTVSPPSGSSLESYLSSGWIQGLQTSTIQSLTINGLPAATALAKSDDWTFRLAAIQLDDSVYRLIFAAHSFTPAEDRKFQDSIATFRRLSPQEAAQVRPLRIQIERAQPGDTVQTFAAKMNMGERPLETFLLLNGLQPADSLRVGEAYKIVTN